MRCTLVGILYAWLGFRNEPQKFGTEGSPCLSVRASSALHGMLLTINEPETWAMTPDDDSPLLKELLPALQQGWGLRPITDEHDGSDWEIVRQALEERVSLLLRRDPAKLATAMYILDISERRFAEAMDQPTHEDRAHALSCVIMERESQKIRTRWKYGGRPAELNQGDSGLA